MERGVGGLVGLVSIKNILKRGVFTVLHTVSPASVPNSVLYSVRIVSLVISPFGY